MFIKTSWISTGGFAAILFCFFLPFMDLKCNDALIAEVSGIELITGQDIHNAPQLPDTLLKDEQNEEATHIDRNYFAVTAFILALAGLILSFAMGKMKEMFLTIIGLAGAMCLFMMKIQLMSKIAKDTDATAKYIVNIEFVFGYWLTLILFLIVAFLNLYVFMEESRKAISNKPTDLYF